MLRVLLSQTYILGICCFGTLASCKGGTFGLADFSTRVKGPGKSAYDLVWQVKAGEKSFFCYGHCGTFDPRSLKNAKDRPKNCHESALRTNGSSGLQTQLQVQGYALVEEEQLLAHPKLFGLADAISLAPVVITVSEPARFYLHEVFTVATYNDRAHDLCPTIGDENLGEADLAFAFVKPDALLADVTRCKIANLPDKRELGEIGKVFRESRVCWGRVDGSIAKYQVSRTGFARQMDTSLANLPTALYCRKSRDESQPSGSSRNPLE
jgi:hypothetical protein